MARIYISVLPLPVTPCSSTGFVRRKICVQHRLQLPPDACLIGRQLRRVGGHKISIGQRIAPHFFRPELDQIELGQALQLGAADPGRKDIGERDGLALAGEHLQDGACISPRRAGPSISASIAGAAAPGRPSQVALQGAHCPASSSSSKGPEKVPLPAGSSLSIRLRVNSFIGPAVAGNHETLCREAATAARFASN